MTDDRPASSDDHADKTLNYRTRPDQPLEWVSVWKPRNTVEANLAVATLQDRGIHARVDTENAAGLNLPYGGVAYGGVQVLAQDAEEARRLLLEIDQQRARRQEAASLKCPNCGTLNPKRILHPLRWAAFAMFALFLLLLPFERAIAEFVHPAWFGVFLIGGLVALIWGVTPRWRCKSCGHRWYAKDPEEIEEQEEDDDDDDDDDQDDHDADEEEDDEDDQPVTSASSPLSQSPPPTPP